MIKLDFTRRVLGPDAASQLLKHQVWQTIRSETADITLAVLGGQLKPGDWIEILLDKVSLGQALYHGYAIVYKELDVNDAQRGGFATVDELKRALRRAGFRFKPLDSYELYRHQFFWLSDTNRQLERAGEDLWAARTQFEKAMAEFLKAARK